MIEPLAIVDQVVGDNFGFYLQFPYSINGWEIRMTVKSLLTLSDDDAEIQVTINPVGVVPDDNGFYNVTLASTAAQTANLDSGTYFFDIVTKDTSNNVAHVLSPQSTVSFIPSVTSTE